MSRILNKLIQHKNSIINVYAGIIGSFTIAGMIEGANMYYQENRIKRNRILYMSNMVTNVMGGGMLGIMYGVFSPVVVPVYISVYTYNKLKEHNEYVYACNKLKEHDKNLE
jgi:hypothetical protein